MQSISEYVITPTLDTTRIGESMVLPSSVVSSYDRVSAYLPKPISDFSTTSLGRYLTKHNINPDTFNGLYRDLQGARNGLQSLSTFNKANTALGAINTALQAYQGFKQLQLANKQFNHAKMESERNFQSQRKTVNSQLEDRQKRRVEEAKVNGTTATSVNDYMNKYGI